MEFRQLEVFAAVAQYQSFSKAADALYLSQSTVSNHIKNLEKEVKKTLILRTTKHLQLTEEGVRFLPYVVRILETKDAALEDLNGPEAQLLHIGASTIPSGYLLPELLSSYRQKHPEVCFSIYQGDSREIIEKVLDGSIEVGFIGKDNTSPKCVSIPFCKDRLVIAAPANAHFLKLRSQKCDIQTLLKEPVILREQGSGTQKAADLYLEEMGVKRSSLNTAAETNDLEAIRKMIINGIGISICSYFSVQELEKQGQIIVFPLKTDIARQFYITYLKGRILKPALQSLIRWIREKESANEDTLFI